MELHVLRSHESEKHLSGLVCMCVCICILKNENHVLEDWFLNLKALFTKFLTPELTHKLCNPLDDWSD